VRATWIDGIGNGGSKYWWQNVLDATEVGIPTLVSKAIHNSAPRLIISVRGSNKYIPLVEIFLSKKRR